MEIILTIWGIGIIYCIFEAIFYTGHMGRGEGLSLEPPDEWSQFSPNSVGEDFVKLVCNL